MYERTWEDILDACEQVDGIQTKSDVKLRARYDYEFFLRYCLGFRVDNELIRDAINTIENPPRQEGNKIKKIARLAPRGHSKTYSWTVGQSLWRSYKEKGTNILIISSTDDQAKGILGEIKKFIKRNEMLQHLEPATDFMNEYQDSESVDIDKDDSQWAAKNITLTTDVTIRARPFTSKIRSKHIEYVFCDDLLDDEASGGKTIDKDKDIYYEAITPAVESQGIWIQVVGTPQDENDLMMELVGEKDSYDSGKYQAYNPETKEVLWEYDPDTKTGWTYDMLQNKRVDMGRARFAKEYMCVEEGTPVQMKHGWKAIEDVEVGDEVLTHKGNYKKVIETFENGEKDVYKIYTPGLREPVGLTGDHPVYTQDGWKKVEKLTDEDFLISPRTYGDKSIREAKAKVYGWYVAEGAIGASGKQVRFCLHEDETDELYNALLELGYTPKFYGGKTEHVDPITVNSKSLAEELEQKLGRAKNKFVWSGIHELDLETQKNFLMAYLAGDGHREGENKYSSRSVCLKVSESMARIATALGWTVTRDYENSRDGLAEFDHGSYEQADFHRVRYYQNPRRAKITDEYIGYPVDDVLKEDSSQVYNLEVEDDNSYHLPMFAVHNCDPLSAGDQYFSDLINPNIDTEAYDEQHWKPNVQHESYDDWQFVLGGDLALQDGDDADYTVFIVLGIDPRGKVWMVDIWRNKGNTSEGIAEKLQELDRRYHFREGHIEKNSVGEGVWTTLHKECPSHLMNRVEEWDTTRKTRPKILSNLQAGLERGDLVLHDHDTLIDEMKAFHKNAKGKLEGKKHDDCVMALAIAYNQLADQEFANTETSMSLISMGGDDDEFRVEEDSEAPDLDVGHGLV